MGILLYYTNNFDALFDIFQKTLDFFRFVYYNAMSELNLIVFRGVAPMAKAPVLGNEAERFRWKMKRG